MAPPVDLIVCAERVLTLWPAQPEVEAVAVTAGRVVALGSREQVGDRRGPQTRVLDWGGCTVVPGFHEAHAHVWKIGQLLTTIADVRGVTSLAELQQRLRRHAGRLGAGQWVVGRGYDEALLTEGRGPTRHDLDLAVPDRPVLLIRTCAHVAVANSLALRLAGFHRGIDAPSGGEVGRDAQGEPNGVLSETAVGLVGQHLPPATPAELDEAIRAGLKHLISLGFTSVTDAGVATDLLERYRDLDTRGELLARVNVMASRCALDSDRIFPVPEPWLSDWLRIDTLKLFADGGLSGGTAALLEPYKGTSSRGQLRLRGHQIVELSRDACGQGFRVAVHAIGDAALEETLLAYEELERSFPGRRHRIEHCGLPTAEQVRRAARLNARVVTQPIFLKVFGSTFRRVLTDQALARVYPVRGLLRAGLAVAFSSDAPVVQDASPLVGLQCALLRQDQRGLALLPREAITAAEALHAYTVAGAEVSGESGNRGCLAPGNWADLVALSDNPLTVPPEELSRVGVRAVMVGSHVRFEG